MSKLPRQLKPKQVVRALEKLGFKKFGSRGSHVHFRHQDGRWTQVAIHPKPIPPGTLKAILRQAKLSIDDLLKNI